jgi:diaminopimelate decarboxylase
MTHKLHTPCWIINNDAISKQVIALQTALNKYFGAYGIGYSVKTNSLPAILHRMRHLGCRAEVVSHDEWQLAKLCGFDAANIIYNGPLKSKETFIEAVSNGAVVNIETKRELLWLEELPKTDRYKVGLRININLSHVSGKDAVRENDNSRFGFSDESSELSDAIQRINAMPHVQLAGLHLHRTTQARRVNYYRHVARYAAIIIQKYGLNLDYIDIGGGFYGTLPGKPGYEDYVKAIHGTLGKFCLDKLKIYLEPGMALIDNGLQFMTEAIDVKQVDEDTSFITTDGSRLDIDPFFRKKLYICKVIQNGDAPRDIVAQQTICGCTCIEEDRITKLSDSPRVAIGDRLIFSNVGAYTMTLTPMFIRYIPRVYAIENGEYKLVRAECNAKRMFDFNNTII